ncbi:hypothetical protein CDAR_565541 [Caerostris darwini]|uniref:Uncharacterized protein n=1 Tax=Caerostris darwini TaxID=1538125 RepID=A0AAV4TX92_9ARAC|nr:hypothetical protein CDAR_565541 [Caerostris darwini]
MPQRAANDLQSLGDTNEDILRNGFHDEMGFKDRTGWMWDGDDDLDLPRLRFQMGLQSIKMLITKMYFGICSQDRKHERFDKEVAYESSFEFIISKTVYFKIKSFACIKEKSQKV